MRVTFLSLVFCLLVSANVFAANEVVPSLVVHKAKELSDDKVYLGISFDMAPGWHIYWKYPGAAGLPTRVKWSVPSGINISEILWPAPERFSQGEGLEGFGYSDHVVLLNEVELPQSIQTGSIEGEIRWLGCNKSLCVPGKASLKIPVSELAVPNKYGQDLARWISLLPMDHHDEVMTEQVNVTGTSPKFHVNAKFTWKVSPTSVEWYPNLNRDVVISNYNLNTTDTVSELSFDIEVLGTGDRPLSEIDSVVTFVSPGSGKKSFEFKFNIK